MSDMTSAVAIDLLDNLIGMFDDNQENDYDSALHMAINALKAQSDGNTISRQDAIDAHYEYCNKHPDAGFPVWSLKILEDLPSAQSERQKGEWIDYTEDGYVECPFCHSATNCDGNKDELHFCFSCGADMRGEQDESD